MQDVNTQKNENGITPSKDTKKTGIFVLKVIGNVIFYLIIILLLLFSIMNINAGSKNGGYPNIFGRGFLSVQTASMERNEDDYMRPEWEDYKIGEINTGDLVFVKNFKSKNWTSLKVGDVISFFDKKLNNGAGAINTHRIVFISSNGSYVLTQGDYQAQINEYNRYVLNPTTDAEIQRNYILETQAKNSNDSTPVEYVEISDIKGVVTGVNHGAGKVFDNIQKNWLFYIVLPVLAFLLFEVFMVVRNIMELKGAKQKADLATDKEAMIADIEATKEEMRRQILAELQAQQTPQTEAKEEEPVVEETPVQEEQPQEATPVEEAKPLAEEVKEEAPIVEEPVEEQPVVEEAPAVKEEKKETEEKPKKTPAKKSTSTTSKKTTSTASKSTAAKKTTGTASKSTTAKKTTSTTKKSTTSSKPKKEAE